MSILIFIIECIIMTTVFGIFVFGLLLVSPLTLAVYGYMIGEPLYYMGKEHTKMTIIVQLICSRCFFW